MLKDENGASGHNGSVAIAAVRPTRPFDPIFERVARYIPEGRPLPGEDWASRHRVVTYILWAHVPGLMVFGVLFGRGVLHCATETAMVAGAAVIASLPSMSRRVRSCAATLGLVASSALLVHFSRGMTEMHFHFFVVIAIVTLYQDWIVFGLAIGFVILHHGILGMIDPKAVYDDPRAIAHPWEFAAIHGAFVLAAAVVNVVAWRFNEDLSLRDPLTKLANRRLFGERLERALARRDRSGSTVNVLLIDLDQFKDVNDSQGHPAGDRLLIEVGKRISNALRAVDTVARLGGDEFAIVLESESGPSVPAAGSGELVAAHLLDVLKAPFPIDGHEVRVDASIGVVTVDAPTAADDVVRNADLALYEAKAAGRGCYATFQTGMADRAVREHELALDLRAALRDGVLEVDYQPTVNLSDGSIRGFEALARWTHPTLGPISPELFIGIAERTGLIIDLGAIVLHRACVQAVQWRARYPALTINVNVAPRQLLDPQLAAVVGAALRESGLEPSALTLELTESGLAQDIGAAVARLTQLKDLGVRLAIDDFGKGHSSLTYLRDLPVDVLKIDKSFVDPLPASRGSEVAAIVATLGRLLGLDVIAEGIERREQSIALIAIGCLHGQGFLFSPPVPRDDATELLARAAHTRGWWDPALETARGESSDHAVQRNGHVSKAAQPS